MDVNSIEGKRRRQLLIEMYIYRVLVSGLMVVSGCAIYCMHDDTIVYECQNMHSGAENGKRSEANVRRYGDVLSTNAVVPEVCIYIGLSTYHILNINVTWRCAAPRVPVLDGVSRGHALCCGRTCL